MANTKENLSKHFFTSETGKEAGKKGGANSGTARKQKKTMQEYLLMYLNQKPTDSKINKLNKAGFVDDDSITNYSLIVASLIQEAEKGNTKAIKLIYEMTDQGKQKALEIKKLKEEIKKLQLEQEKLKLQTGDGATFEDLKPLAELLRIAPEEEATGN